MDSSDINWWVNVDHATVVVGSALPTLTGGRQLYTIVQQFGPSYIGALTQADVDGYWIPSGARVYPFDGVLPPPPPYQGPTVDPTLGTPNQGEYYADLAAGIIQLGAVTGGADLRVDAQAIGYQSYNLGSFIKNVCNRKGVKTNPSYIAELVAGFPSLVGYFTGIAPLNCLNVLDEVVFGSVCWW